MTAKEKIIDAGWEGSVIFENPSYDDALIGVSHDGRAIYDYELMIQFSGLSSRRYEYSSTNCYV